MRMIFLAVFAATLGAADFYVAQTATGTDDGTACTSAHSAQWFNTAGNWANPKQAGKVGPGDTVHLCGTITTSLNVRASGSEGAVITILWEAGAKLSQPAATLMSTTGKDYLLIDGGTNGVIENTDNGTLLANKVAGVQGIAITGSEHIEIRNLIIRGLYVHTAVDDNTAFATRQTGIYSNGPSNDVTIHHCSFDDMLTGILLSGASGASGARIYNNTFRNCDHGVTINGADTLVSSDGYSDVRIYNNHFGSTVNWDTTRNLWHHDGIHVYHPKGYVLTGLMIYNNLFDGDWGRNNTAMIFLEGEYGATDNPGSGIKNTTIFNNVFAPTNSRMNNGALAIKGLNTHVLNNTFLGSGSNDLCATGGNNTLGLVFKNNLLTSCRIFLGTVIASTTDANWNHNLYADGYPSGAGLWIWSATAGGTVSRTSDIGTWRGLIGADSQSSYVASAGLGNSGRPQAGSAVVAAGENLSSLVIIALNSDKAGVARPVVGAWDIGAYQHTGFPAALQPPSNLKSTVQ